MFITNHRHARGAASSNIVITILILLALCVAGWFLVINPYRQATQSTATTTTTATKKKAAAKVAPPPANVSAMSTDQLLSEASKALKDQRLLAPAGNNAFEFYLKVLERQPNNQVAKDALRETFPFGANAAEQDINSRDFAAAQRDIDLLAKADPDNYTLTILRSKLDAQRKTASKEQQQAQAQLLADQQAKQQAAADAAAKKQAAEQAQAEAASKAKADKAEKLAARNSGQPSQQEQASEQQSAPQKVNIQNAVLIKKVNPRYPTSAVRRRREGWVDVQFTVTRDGSTTNVSAVDAQPKHVFERDAVSAVERWKFRPALNNGKPFPVTMRKRINFSLGNQ